MNIHGKVTKIQLLHRDLYRILFNYNLKSYVEMNDLETDVNFVIDLYLYRDYDENTINLLKRTFDKNLYKYLKTQINSYNKIIEKLIEIDKYSELCNKLNNKSSDIKSLLIGIYSKLKKNLVYNPVSGLQKTVNKVKPELNEKIRSIMEFIFSQIVFELGFEEKKTIIKKIIKECSSLSRYSGIRETEV